MIFVNKIHSKYKLPEPPYQWRTWMSGGTFKVNMVEYTILEGTWLMKDNESVNAIRFKNKRGETFIMAEQEIFSKISINDIKIK